MTMVVNDLILLLSGNFGTNFINQNVIEILKVRGVIEKSAQSTIGIV